MITARWQSLEIKNQLQQTTADIGIFNRKMQTLINTDIAFTRWIPCYAVQGLLPLLIVRH